MEKWQAIKDWRKLGIIILFCIVVGGIYVYKNMNPEKNSDPMNSSVHNDAKLPRLVDIGANTCIPCKQMAPILAELEMEYAGRMVIEVIDVSVNREAARRYNIRVIPTQILFDAEGKEISRHEGFIPKKDLVEAFKMVGVK